MKNLFKAFGIITALVLCGFIVLASGMFNLGYKSYTKQASSNEVKSLVYYNFNNPKTKQGSQPRVELLDQDLKSTYEIGFGNNADPSIMNIKHGFDQSLIVNYDYSYLLNGDNKVESKIDMNKTNYNPIIATISDGSSLMITHASSDNISLMVGNQTYSNLKFKDQDLLGEFTYLYKQQNIVYIGAQNNTQTTVYSYDLASKKLSKLTMTNNLHNMNGVYFEQNQQIYFEDTTSHKLIAFNPKTLEITNSFTFKNNASTSPSSFYNFDQKVVSLDQNNNYYIYSLDGKLMHEFKLADQNINNYFLKDDRFYYALDGSLKVVDMNGNVVESKENVFDQTFIEPNPGLYLFN